MKLKIYFSDEQNKTRTNLGLRMLVERAVRTALSCEGFTDDAVVSVTFTDDGGIRERNREFRGIDSPTDVLSFPMYDFRNGDEPEKGEPAVLGDIVISLERAYRQSLEYGHSYKREVAFLTVHSVLHLLGYDHEVPEDEEEMRARQRIIMDRLGIRREPERKK